MADHRFTFKLKRRAMIAVMGLPYTFRQEMGNYIANWAKCPNLKLEVTRSDEQGAALINPDDAAFDIMCKTAVSLLENYRYQPNCVVINFPTPTLPQLNKLISLHVYGDEKDGEDEDEFEWYGHYCIRPHRLLIIECQRQNKFRWRQAVEDPSRGNLLNPRYRTRNTEPGKWEDVEKAILNHQHQGLDDYLLTLQAECCDVGVKKLVVDPFEDLRPRDFTKEGLDRRSLFAEAIKSYLACDDHEYEALSVNLDYASWRRQWLERQASSRRGISSEHRLCEPGDCILRFIENLKEAEAICDACEEKVGEEEAAYYCQFCSLCLHQLCALALSPTLLTSQSPMILHSEVVDSYVDPLYITSTIFKDRSHACNSCINDGKQFSKDCDGCVFRSHLKLQLLPTALKHSCDEPHFLSIRLMWRSNYKQVYDCKACGLMGMCSSYCCNICNSEYHLPCVLDMPLHTNQISHGGHSHTLNIHFSCGQREHEYEWCPVCYDDINPETWAYTCQDCDFVAHLYCIFPSNIFKVYKHLSRMKF